jgi:hypothetical protein
MIAGDTVVGVGSFHKTLPHNDFGEVDSGPFQDLVNAARGDGSGFANVPAAPEKRAGKPAAKLTNPQAGLAKDQLTHEPKDYSMPPAPKVDSVTTAAEMTELYWMALLRDEPLNTLAGKASGAVKEINKYFPLAMADTSDAGRLQCGIDIPGSAAKFDPFTKDNIFRLGLPGDEFGPMLSQFFMRPVAFGTQTIDQQEHPYASGLNYLTEFDDWLLAQKTGNDKSGRNYGGANEDSVARYERKNGKLVRRYISTMRDLARFVNKDALHQAYFNAALILLSGEAKWTQGNPYGDGGRLEGREAGFGVLGGPHILSLVSEVATRALKVVWNQKWQVNLRLRPEAYGGLVHVQNLGVKGRGKRDYGLPDWIASTDAAKTVRKAGGTYLLPMAFTPGSPTHPAYGAGHATVAGACVTVLKAYFKTLDDNDKEKAILFNTLYERSLPYGDKYPIVTYVTGCKAGKWDRFKLDGATNKKLTIEGELNKLAQNVAMGRSMGGVHWRTDNTRSLILGEALAAEILADITTDVNEKPVFEFRTFARDAKGKPSLVRIEKGQISVNGKPPFQIPISKL